MTERRDLTLGVLAPVNEMTIFGCLPSSPTPRFAPEGFVVMDCVAGYAMGEPPPGPNGPRLAVTRSEMQTDFQLAGDVSRRSSSSITLTEDCAETIVGSEHLDDAASIAAMSSGAGSPDSKKSERKRLEEARAAIEALLHDAAAQWGSGTLASPESMGFDQLGQGLAKLISVVIDKEASAARGSLKETVAGLELKLAHSRKAAAKQLKVREVELEAKHEQKMKERLAARREFVASASAKGGRR